MIAKLSFIIKRYNPNKMSDSPKKRPGEIGIKSYTEDIQGSPDSPMRKKKKTLGSLNLNPTATETQEEAAPPADLKKEFAKYEVLFADVMSNFERKKSEFEDLKKMKREALIVYNNEVKLENIPGDWRR